MTCTPKTKQTCQRPDHYLGAVGYTYRAKLIDPDCQIVNVEADEVDLIVESPNGEYFVLPAITVGAPSNVVEYIVTASDATDVFDVAGTWRRYWRWTDGTTNRQSEIEEFEIEYRDTTL